MSEFASSGLTAGQLNAIVKRLGGHDAALKFLSGELTVSERPLSSPELKVWKTIRLGQYPGTNSYEKALQSAGFCISESAGQILKKITWRKGTLDLVVLSVAELGFTDGAHRDTIYARAQQLGLELCPAEVGPALRLAYPDQPVGERLIIAMEPLIASGEYAGVFHVARFNDDRWLNTFYSGLEGVWNPPDRWVFWRK